MVNYVPKGSEEEKNLRKIYEFDTNVRGKYLIQANWIEFYLAEIIAMHFFPNTVEDHRYLHSIINKQVGFVGKIKTFQKMLETHYPELHEKYLKIGNLLDGVRDFRNKIAHSVLDTSEEFLKKNQFDRIRLEFNSDGKTEFYEITKELIDKKLNDTGIILQQLLEILESLEKKHTKS